MPELPFEFEVYCARCGAGLCNNCSEGTTRGRGMPFINVEPCEKCLESSKDEGYNEGYDSGNEDGRKEE